MPDKPIMLSVEMTDQGYWRVTWSIRPGLRLPVTACRVGIGRSEAIEDTAVIACAYAAREARRP